MPTISLACELYLGHLSIPSSKPNQRLTLPHHDLFHFRDKNRMIARLIGGLQPTLEIRNRAIENRRSMLRMAEPRSGFSLGAVVSQRRRPGRVGIILRNRRVALREHIDPEALASVQVRMRASIMVDADQHERRIERHRSERIGGHAFDFAGFSRTLVANRDDGDAGRKRAQSTSKFCG